MVDYKMQNFEMNHIGHHVSPGILHRHNTNELVIVECGQSTIVSNERIYKVSGMYAIFYPREIIHVQKNDPTVEYSRYCINYDVGSFDDILKKLSPTSFFVIKLYDEELKRIKCWLDPLYAFSQNGVNLSSIRDRNRCGYLLALTLNELAPLIRERTPDYGAVDGSDFLNEVCFYINNHCAEHLSIDLLAERFFTSRSTLIRGFNTAFGMTPGAYITSARIAKAKYLLHEGLSVADAAGSCGFSTPSYFIKVFKDTVGITPSVFAKTLKN